MTGNKPVNCHNWMYIYCLWQNLCIYGYANFLVDQLFSPWLHIGIIWGVLKIVWGWPRTSRVWKLVLSESVEQLWLWTPALDCEFLEGQDFYLWTPWSAMPENNCWLKLGTQCWKSLQRAAMAEWKVHGLWCQKKNLSLPLNCNLGYNRLSEASIKWIWRWY